VTEMNMPRRLSFPVCPEVDVDSMRDRHILVAEDAWNGGGLIVIPHEMARHDKAYIDAIMDARTVGELRKDARAWAAASERYDQDRVDDEKWDQPASEELADSHPYDPNSWFGDDSLVYVLPLARLRTAETAPACLDSLAREDTAIGMDYEQAAWWSVDDIDEIKQILLRNDYILVDDHEVISRYSNY
jgi:hypothetical protein